LTNHAIQAFFGTYFINGVCECLIDANPTVEFKVDEESLGQPFDL